MLRVQPHVEAVSLQTELHYHPHEVLVIDHENGKLLTELPDRWRDCGRLARRRSAAK